MREKSGSFNPLFEAKSLLLLLLPQKMPLVYLLGDLRLRNVHSHTQTHTHTGFPNAKKCFIECTKEYQFMVASNVNKRI